MCREFAEAVSELWRTIGYALNSYRPELHYMRGPGPKWHAKHTASEKLLSMRMERNASSHPDPARQRNRRLGHLWNSSLPRQVAARLGPFRPEMPDAGDHRFGAPPQGTGLRIAGNLLPPPFSHSRSVQPKRGEFCSCRRLSAQAPPLFCRAIAHCIMALCPTDPKAEIFSRIRMDHRNDGPAVGRRTESARQHGSREAPLQAVRQRPPETGRIAAVT